LLSAPKTSGQYPKAVLARIILGTIEILSKY